MSARSVLRLSCAPCTRARCSNLWHYYTYTLVYVRYYGRSFGGLDRRGTAPQAQGRAGVPLVLLLCTAAGTCAVKAMVAHKTLICYHCMHLHRCWWHRVGDVCETRRCRTRTARQHLPGSGLLRKRRIHLCFAGKGTAGWNQSSLQWQSSNTQHGATGTRSRWHPAGGMWHAGQRSDKV